MLNNDGMMEPNTVLGTERVSVILRRCATGIVEGWLARAKQSSDLMVVPLSDEQRAVHIPRVVEDLIVRLSKSSAAMNDCDAIFICCRRGPWQAAVSAGLRSRNARRRIANTGGDHFRNVAEQPSFPGCHPAVARCHGYRGRGGCAVDPVNWRLQRNS
jgi:hypothetical protein